MSRFAPPVLLTPESPSWPTRLSDLQRPPPSLRLLGCLPGARPLIAIVGTRRPDARGAAFARQLARDLAEEGCTVISGGALGIDTEAHRGALDVDGATLAVLATGLARPYPGRNQRLFQQILARGGLLSESDGCGPVFKSDFLERNRLVAALADVVVVVQAPVASGALSTAAHARKLGRRLLAVPHAPWQREGEGCLALLAAGAGVCRSHVDVLASAALASTPGLRTDVLAAGARCAVPTRRRTPVARPTRARIDASFDDDQRRIFDALAQGPRTADALCDASGLPAPRVQRAVLMLLLAGAIQETGSGRYARHD